MFAVLGDPQVRRFGFGSKGEAIGWAREQKLTAFEVIDDDDRSVYTEFPQAVLV